MTASFVPSCLSTTRALRLSRRADFCATWLVDSGGSPNTAVAYGYDLRYLFEFLAERELDRR